MKIIYTFIFLVVIPNSYAQWSNTTNQFTDDQHMQVSIASGMQNNSIVIKSYPDNGYIIIWEDNRTAGNQADIYAQKYDIAGVALWATNGIPVATGVGLEQIAPSSSADNRNYSHAVSDNAGGFFIGYQETAQLGSYNRAGVAVQHLDAAGNALYAGAGLVIAQPLISGNNDYGMPQLVADGQNGFFVSYATYTNSYANYVYVEAYRLNGNALQLYASQRMNEDAYQKSNLGPCGVDQLTLQYMLPTLYDYQIWADGQGGCNVIMNMAASDGTTNTGAQRILAYNALKRVKKSCTTITTRRISDIAKVDTVITFYQKDSVIRLYNLQTFAWSYITNICVNINYQLENFGLGYDVIASGFYDAYFTKGVTATTTGNINVSAVTSSERQYSNNQVTPFVTKMYTWPEEIYDSIPYQRTSSTQLYRAYQIFPPATMNTLNNIRDTILNTATNYHEFSLAASGNKIYATARLPQLLGVGDIYLQQLQVNRVNANSFAVVYNTPAKTGVLIGKEKSTGFSGSNISYDNPRIATDNLGNALFYIREYNRAIRVSPIRNGTELAWGAMGKPLGSGYYNGSPYTMDRPFAIKDNNGTAVISWDDQKNLNPNTGDNIFMRHLDNLNALNSLPPVKPIMLLPFGNNFAFPVVLLGTSNAWSTIDTYTSTNSVTATPVVQVLDNFNLGAVDVNVYQNINAIRTYNNKPYLDRNYTILAQNNPNGAATIDLQLYFTTAEFNALKAADPSIVDPGSLVVTKQPNSTLNAPSAYIPVAGETIIIPSAWQAVVGGYYIQISVNSFSNFFIESGASALPVTWLGIQAQWINRSEAKVSWQVAQQKNVKDYTVQYSEDGSTFKNVCTVNASPITSYNCIAQAFTNTKNYYRVMQQDIDGRITYSKIVLLQSFAKPALFVYLNPAKDKLYLQGINNYSEATISDVGGKINNHFLLNANIQYIDVSKLTKGIYFIKLMSVNDTQTLKFIKE